MEMPKLVRLFGVVVLSVSVAGAAAAQGKKAAPGRAAPEKTAPKMSPAEARMMEAMVKAGTPGKEHQALKDMTGNWDAAVTMFMPKKPPVKSSGKVLKKMILGDRYLAERFVGTMMGKPFKGLGTVGFDNAKQKYVMVWFDDMSTGIWYTEGTPDKEGKVVTFNGTATDPVTGKAKKNRLIVKVVSPKKHISEIYDLPKRGKPVKTMEIVYTKTN